MAIVFMSQKKNSAHHRLKATLTWKICIRCQILFVCVCMCEQELNKVSFHNILFHKSLYSPHHHPHPGTKKQEIKVLNQRHIKMSFKYIKIGNKSCEYIMIKHAKWKLLFPCWLVIWHFQPSWYNLEVHKYCSLVFHRKFPFYQQERKKCRKFYIW